MQFQRSFYRNDVFTTYSAQPEERKNKPGSQSVTSQHAGTLVPHHRRIKKLAPELRRRKPNYESEPRWYRRLLWRLKTDSQFLRSIIQASFALLCAWIGVEFYFFVQWGISG